MAVRHEGVSPGKLWYAWQKTKGFFKTFGDKSYGRDAKFMTRQAGIASGIALAGYAAQAALYIPVLVPLLSTVAAVGGAGWFGWQAYQKASLLKNSPVVNRYVREREDAWLARKERGPLGKRFRAAVKRGFGKAALPFVRVGKWLGLAGAGAGAALGIAGGLQLAGLQVIPAAVLGAIASAGAGFGVAAAGALMAATGLCVLAVPAGIVAGILCRKAEDRLEGASAPAPASAGQQPQARSSFKDESPAAGKAGIQKEFAASAPAPASAASLAIAERRRKNAEERAKRREQAKKSGRPRF